VLPRTIEIKINADAFVRFNLEIFEPYMTTNTGLRIKAKFVHMLSKALGIPWGFTGIYEWLNFVETVPVQTWVETEGSQPSEKVMKWFDILTKCIIQAKKKILIQNKTEVHRISELIVYKIIQAAVVICMENSVWAKGMKEKGVAWNSEVVRGHLRYSRVAEPEAAATWTDWISRTIAYLGYEYKGGSKTFNCMLDLGHPLSEYTFIGIKAEEISSRPVKLDLTSVMIDSIRFYDLNTNEWYPMTNAAIYRDGTIVPGEWSNHAVMMITKIDDWVNLFHRTGAFENPHLKISIVPVLNGWQEKLEELGIKDAYAGLGYDFEVSGKILPVRMDHVETKVYATESENVVNRIIKQRLGV
jgi:hypothetical protein